MVWGASDLEKASLNAKLVLCNERDVCLNTSCLHPWSCMCYLSERQAGISQVYRVVLGTSRPHAEGCNARTDKLKSDSAEPRKADSANNRLFPSLLNCWKLAAHDHGIGCVLGVLVRCGWCVRVL